MKKFVMKYFLVLFSLALIFTGSTFAQDTVTVDPGFNALLDAVNNNPGKTLLLKRGGVYVQDQPIQINQPTTIIGETEPVEDPPAQIVPFELSGNPTVTSLFEVYADVVYKNLAITGWVVGDIRHIGFLVKLLEPGLTFTIDHCVVNHLYVLYNHPGLNNLNLNITNNIFWQGWNPPRWHEGYFGYWAGDSVDYNFNNNTIIGYGRALDFLGDGPHGIQKYKHNTFAGCVGNDIFYERGNSDFIVQNNIFYNIASVGYVGPRPDWGNPYPGDQGEVNEDSLFGELGTMDFHPLGVDGDNLGIDDYARDIQVNNNLRYSNDHLFAHLTEATASYIPFLSDTVLARFAKYGWRFENNILETVENGVRTSGTDPQFVDVDSLSRVTEIQYAWDLCRRDSAHVPAFEAKYGSFPAKWPGWLPINPKTGEKYKLADVIWPIPMDLTPTNPAILTAGDDGYPLGDLNWFGPEVVAAWEAGLPNPLTAVEDNRVNLPSNFELKNNYPNPFNPTTNIEFSLAKSGITTLKVYSITGELVRTLVDENLQAGTHKYIFNGKNNNGYKLSSGMYIYELKSGVNISSKKMFLIK